MKLNTFLVICTIVIVFAIIRNSTDIIGACEVQQSVPTNECIIEATR